MRPDPTPPPDVRKEIEIFSHIFIQNRLTHQINNDFARFIKKFVLNALFNIELLFQPEKEELY